MLAFVLRVCK